jgi:hypothetical protein
MSSACAATSFADALEQHASAARIALRRWQAELVDDTVFPLPAPSLDLSFEHAALTVEKSRVVIDDNGTITGAILRARSVAANINAGMHPVSSCNRDGDESSGRVVQ